jgi:hypothetical protein
MMLLEAKVALWMAWSGGNLKCQLNLTSLGGAEVTVQVYQMVDSFDCPACWSQITFCNLIGARLLSINLAIADASGP